MRALAITIDLDSPTEYAAIHGTKIDAEDPHLMYRGPLDRFTAICKTLGAPGTVFAISRDVCGIASDKLRGLRADGFEIASHSHNHDYHLSRRQPGYMLNDLRASKRTFEEELGFTPVGFRAPGYHLSSALMDEIEGAGFAYDSSVMPSPPYWAAKAAVMTGYWVASRPTRALLGSWRSTTGPRSPYRPGRDPYTHGNRKLIELPVSVATKARLPATGGALLTLPPTVRSLLVRALQKEDVLVINIHGMDLVDPAADALPSQLVPRQPELKHSIDERDTILRTVLATLAGGRELLTCEQIAARLS